MNTDAIRDPESRRFHESYQKSHATARMTLLSDENKELRYKIHKERLASEQKQAQQESEIEYLRHELEDREGKLQKLIKKLANTTLALERTKKRLAEEKAELAKTLVANNETLARDNDELRLELEAVKEFRARKTANEAEMQALRRALQEERDTAEQRLGDAERRALSEKEVLKQDMLLKIRDIKRSLLGMTRESLHSTTKRILCENELYSVELQFQSAISERLAKEIDEIRREHEASKLQLLLAREMETELARKLAHRKARLDAFATTRTGEQPNRPSSNAATTSAT
ncbi:MAG: hypothetical protein MHM6MM_006706 [Cercozoa sp. M6MM]